MLNIIPPSEVLAGVGAALRELVLPAVSGRNERRQCRAAAHLVELLAAEIERYGDTVIEERRDYARSADGAESDTIEQARAKVAQRLRHHEPDDALDELRLLVRRSLDRWIALTPPGPLGHFERLDGAAIDAAA